MSSDWLIHSDLNLLKASLKTILSEIKKQELTKEFISNFSTYVSEASTKLNNWIQNEIKRRGTKNQALSNSLPEFVFDIFTQNDPEEEDQVGRLLNEMKKMEKTSQKYFEKYLDEMNTFNERMIEIDGSEDYNQKRIVEMRHANKKGISQQIFYPDVSDRISILVTSFGCWRLMMLVIKMAKPSPKSQSCRQHISSPTSVTNIDVAELYF